MKNCHKWMLLCVAVAFGVFVILPMFGVAIAGASLIFPLLMIGCCVIPMIMMTASNSAEGRSGCCGKKEGSKVPKSGEKALNPNSEKPSCH